MLTRTLWWSEGEYNINFHKAIITSDVAFVVPFSNGRPVICSAYVIMFVYTFFVVCRVPSSNKMDKTENRPVKWNIQFVLYRKIGLVLWNELQDFTYKDPSL